MATNFQTEMGILTPFPMEPNSAPNRDDTKSCRRPAPKWWSVPYFILLLLIGFSTSALAAAPTYQAQGTAVAGTGAITPTWPTHAIGDIALLIVETANQTVTLSSNTAGFAQVTNSPQGTGTAGAANATGLAVFWTRATSTSMAAPTVANSGDHQIAQIVTFRGVTGAATPWDVTAGDVLATASTAFTIPGATTSVANTLVVAITSDSADTNTTQHSATYVNASLTGLTERVDSNTNNGNGGGFGVATGVMATAGTYGNTTGTQTTSTVQAHLSIALKPPLTTLGTGSDPTATTIAPGAAATDVDQFTLQTDAGTETLTSVTVNLSSNSGVGRLAITNSTNTELGFTTSPATGSNTITVSSMSATTTATTFKVRVTPLSATAMPPVPGGSYAITAPVTAWAGSGTYEHTGSDTDAAALTIDNLSPGDVSSVAGTTGTSNQVTLTWTNPADADFGSVVVLRKTSAISDVPVEGSTYSVGNTIGTSTVACVVTAPTATCTDTGLTNGTAYYYKLFSKDTNGNYAFGITAGSFMPTGAPSKLAIIQQPTSTTSGTAISPSITVQIQDASGYLTTSTAAVTLAIGTNPGGGTLSGTVTVNAVAGVATFSGLSINKTGTGYTLTASSSGLTSATSSAFNITAGTATKLAFFQQPSNTTLATAITPAITVQIQDANGNVTTSTANVTLAIGTNPSSGTLSGTLTVAAVAGTATFSTAKIDKAGTGYTLTAASSGLTGTTSGSFNITALPASQLAFSVQPGKTAPNTAISPAITVLVQDSAGNTITGSTAVVTLAIGNNPGSGTLGGTTSVAAVAGVATFSNLSINSIGTGYTLVATGSGLSSATSNAFNITTATKLAFYQQPANTSAGSLITPAVSVQIQDAAGNPVTTSTDTVTVAIGNNAGPGGTLSGTLSVAAVNGIATFNLSINVAGTGYTLTASATGMTGATSGSFNITPLVCYTDNFVNLANWSVGNQGGAFGNPVAVGNRMRLSDTSGSVSTYASLQRLFPAYGNKVVVEFLHYAYGGSNPGADGIGIVLSDASQAPVAGAYGGSMGYAPKRSDQGGDTTHPGFVGGWLGVAIDEYGNFSANTEGRTGGNAPGQTPESVSVRGSGTGYTGYSYITGTASSPGGKGIDLDYTTQAHLTTSGPGYKYRIIVDHSDAIHAYTSVERDFMQGPGGTASGYSFLIQPFDAKAQPGQATVPTNWYLSYTGASGGATNYHEVVNLTVCSNSSNTPGLDHIEIDHPASGFPGVAAPITIKACADAACSTLYLNSVTVALTSQNFPALTTCATCTWASTPVTFTGGQTTVTLTDSTSGTVALGGTASSPTAANATTCYIGATASCNMVFATVTFDAVEVSAAQATPLFTKLSGVNFNLDVVAISAGAINTTFNGAVTVDLVDPTAASGNCTDTNPGLTGVTITPASPYTFTTGTGRDNGRHTFTFNYPNAAKNVQVRIRNGSLVYCSSDNFVIRPQVLTMSTTSSLNPTTNTLAAGTNFNLTASATGSTAITAGYDGLPVIDPTLATVLDQNNAALTLGSLTGNFSNGTGTAAVGNSFQYQDVGTISFQANAITDSVFFNQDQHTGVYNGIDHGVNGDCVFGSTSNTLVGGRYGCNIGSTALGPLGKFVPDHFTLVSGSVTPACNGFTYMGQPFGIAYLLEARNVADVRTQKYTTANPPYTPIPTPSLTVEDDLAANQGTDLGSRIGNLPTTTWLAGQYTLSAPAATFTRPSAPVATPLTPNGGGPFDSLIVGVKMVDGTAVIANRNMNASAVGDCATLSNCDAKQLPTGNPSSMRFGILKMDSASGSQLLNLSMPLKAMYMSTAPSTFLVNTLDNCTTVPSTAVALGNVAPTGSLLAPTVASLAAMSSGVTSIVLAQGATKYSGNADVVLNLGTGVVSPNSCVASLSGQTGGTTPNPSLSYLLGNWCGSNYDRAPSAKVTFGSAKSVFIYMREKY